jgi:imidazolonepropionase-like amidohydrolase
VPVEDLTRQLQLMLTQYGFTSVFDTWSNLGNTRRIRDRIDSGEIPGPRIRTTGEALMPKQGALPSFAFGLYGFGPAEIQAIDGVASAQAAATKILDGGADGLKVYAMTFAPRVAMPEDAMQAAFAEVHRRGKLAFAHPTRVEALLAAVRAGADVIVHTTPQSPVWDASVLTPMKEKGVALIPTLKLWHSELKHDRLSAQQLFVDNGVAQLRAWLGVGGTVLFGTDVGYMDDYTTAQEYELMAKAGMTHRQILASLTTAPAERFGDAQRLGKVASGFAGDLVVMRGDPAQSVVAFSNVSHTIRDGKIIYSSDSRAR